jgi:glucose-1-phosphate cytidylyltransferase
VKVGILAGGMGSRLTEETRTRPKPMVEIGGKPIVWHIMRHYLHHGFNDFVIALGYKGEDIKRYMVEYHLHDKNLSIDMGRGSINVIDGDEPENWTVTLIETGANSETGARIKLLAPFLGNETFMLTYGDGVANVDLTKLIDFHRAHGKLATLTAVHPPSRFGKLEVEGDHVLRFAEKPQFAGEGGIQTGEGWINAGYFVLEPGAIDYIDDDPLTKWELGPLERLAKDGELMVYRHYDFWQCMDTLRDKNFLESLWASERAPWRVWE